MTSVNRGPSVSTTANTTAAYDHLHQIAVTSIDGLVSNNASAAASNTQIINAALARGGNVSITTQGVYFLAASRTVAFNGNTYQLCLSIPSNTTFQLGSGVTLKIASGLTNPVLIQNTNPTPGVFTGNENITIEGGIWDGNKAGSTRSDGTAMCSFMLWFTSVTNLRIQDVLLQNSITYHGFFSSILTFRVLNYKCFDDFPAVNGDGLHIHGNMNDVIVRNVSGNVGDDLLAIFTRDTAHTYTQVLDSGPITHLLVDGVFGYRPLNIGNIVDFTGYPMTNVTVRNVMGTYTNRGINVDGIPGVKNGIFLDNIQCSPSTGSFPSGAQIRLGGGGDSIALTNIRRAYADGVEGNAKKQSIWIESNVNGGTWREITIDGLQLSDTTAAGIAISPVLIQGGSSASITKLSIRNAVLKCTTQNASTSLIQFTNNYNVIRMFLDGVDCENVSTVAWCNNGKIGALLDARGVYSTGNNAPAFRFTTAKSVPVLNLSGVVLDGTQGGASGCIAFDGSGLTGSCLINMDMGCVFNNGANANVVRSASESIRVRSLSVPVPNALLTAVVGDVFLDASNSNAPYRCSTAPSTFTAL